MAQDGPKEPKREDAGVVGTSPLNASGGSIAVEGRKDALSLGVPNCELDGVMLSSGGAPEVADEELEVGGMGTSAPSAGAGDGALADGVS